MQRARPKIQWAEPKRSRCLKISSLPCARTTSPRLHRKRIKGSASRETRVVMNKNDDDFHKKEIGGTNASNGKNRFLDRAQRRRPLRGRTRSGESNRG